MTTTMRKAALADVLRARRSLSAARQGYHLALVIADDRGIGSAQIADVLGTSPLYVQNAIRKHRDGSCGCDA